MRICVHTEGLRDYGLEDCYEMIRQAGFEGVDWDLNGNCTLSGVNRAPAPLPGDCVLSLPLKEVLAHYGPELSAIRERGLAVAQAHAPFPAWAPDRPGSLDFAIGVYVRCVELCREIGCGNLVIHGVPWPFGAPGVRPGDAEEMNLRLYRGLIPALRRGGVTVLMENIFVRRGKAFEAGHCAEAEQAAKLIDRLNGEAGGEYFGLALDTGHLNILRGTFRQFVPALGGRIKALHIHDNDGTEDSHLAPGGGNICWPEFCDALREIGYRGDLSFETVGQISPAHLYNFRELAPPALSYIAAVGRVFRARISGEQD